MNVDFISYVLQFVNNKSIIRSTNLFLYYYYLLVLPLGLVVTLLTGPEVSGSFPGTAAKFFSSDELLHATDHLKRLAGDQWSRSAKDSVLWKELEKTLTL